MKRSEDGTALIVRYYNAVPRPAMGRVNTNFPASSAKRCNLLEVSKAMMLAELQGNGITFAVLPNAYELQTIRLVPKRD